ncbi:MAG: hypothetical protein EA377_13280 [Phycisphaerales bacterium]|nr:MAG: hypothetical protein EA377_13280 [Phycisphaerales bacterium]
MSVLAGAGALLIAGTASADFLGFSISEAGTYNDGTNNWVSYQVTADFGAGGGTVGFIGGGTVTNNASDFVSLGSGLFVAGFQSGGLPTPAGPLFSAFEAELTASSYVTLGVEAGYDANNDVGQVFLTTPGFPNWGNLAGGSAQFDIVDDQDGFPSGVVSAPGSVNNTVAGAGSILLAQFTIQQGEFITWDGFTASVDGEVLTGMVTTVPAPGALALLGLAGLAGARRRRA